MASDRPPAKKATRVARRVPPKSVNSRTLKEEASVRMAKANFDPLEWAIKIATGKALLEDHPFLDHIDGWVTEWKKRICNRGEALGPEELDDFLEEARAHLTESHTPIKIRADQIRDLLGYVYPKLKAIEHSGKIQQDISLKPLTATEAKKFSRTFEDNY